MNSRGDKEEGLYSDIDSQDETELINILNNKIIHPYNEDNAVIFHKNVDTYNYDRLTNFSPVESDDDDSENSNDKNFKVITEKIENKKDLYEEEDIINLSDIEDNISDDFTDAKES